MNIQLVNLQKKKIVSPIACGQLLVRVHQGTLQDNFLTYFFYLIVI